MNIKIDISSLRQSFQSSGNFSTPGWAEAFKALNSLEDFEQGKFKIEEVYEIVQNLLRAGAADLKWLDFMLLCTEYLFYKQNREYSKSQ
jgi:hypothetical protein